MQITSLLAAIGAAAVLAGCAFGNPTAVLSEQDPRVTVELLPTDCTVEIPLMVFAFNGIDNPKAAIVLVGDEQVLACWADINGQVGIADEAGGAGVVPKSLFSPQPK